MNYTYLNKYNTVLYPNKVLNSIHQIKVKNLTPIDTVDLTQNFVRSNNNLFFDGIRMRLEDYIVESEDDGTQTVNIIAKEKQ